MLVLSLHEGHNASAAIAHRGLILAAAAEERFSRKKNFMGFPYHAATYCLRAAGVRGHDLDQVVMITRHIDPLVVRIARSTEFSTQEHVRQQYEYFSRLHSGEDEITIRRNYANSCPTHSQSEFYDFSRFGEYTTQLNDAERFLKIRQNAITHHLGTPIDRIHLIDHHTCHAAYAYCASPFRKHSVLVFTADCIGDDVSATVWLVDELGYPKQLQRTKKQILGYTWRYVTLKLGMIPLEHEYKVMGLAPYGHRHYELVKYVFDSFESIRDGEWERQDRFGHYFEVSRKLEGFRFDQIAAGLQTHTEEILSEWMRFWVVRTGVQTVVFSGGLALNVKANTFLANQNWVEKFHVPPGGSDESLPLGACYLSSIKSSNEWGCAVPLVNSYLGPSFDNIQVERIIEKYRAKNYRIYSANPDVVAKFLSDGYTIGRCCGRMEFGPRALGNRSILARADRLEVVKILNEQVKQRDWWMPFAPIIREENAALLVNFDKELDGSFMTLCFNITELGKKELAAAHHPIDGSSRAQILKKDSNPELESILTAYEKLTGLHALVNTSFNLHGEPIVLNAEQAVDTFFRSALDGLLFPKTLIIRDKNEFRMD